jgi:L-amino acid N-acyltransferase YncA
VTPRIRPARPCDAQGFLEVHGPVVAGTAISFELEVPTKREMASRIAAGLTYAQWLVAVEDGRVIGYAYASQHRERAAYRWSIDVSVHVHAAARRSGVGRALYTALLARRSS